MARIGDRFLVIATAIEALPAVDNKRLTVDERDHQVGVIRGEVVLGEGVHLYRGTIVEIGCGGSVRIGDHAHIQSHCNIKGFLGSTIIGRNVQIAPHCGFSPYEHGMDDLHTSIRDQKITSSGDIVLEDDVWLGLNVQVLDGVRIGEGTVVGAGAVVTKSLPSHCIAVGVPARVIRRRGESGSMDASRNG